MGKRKSTLERTTHIRIFVTDKKILENRMRKLGVTSANQMLRLLIRTRGTKVRPPWL